MEEVYSITNIDRMSLAEGLITLDYYLPADLPADEIPASKAELQEHPIYPSVLLSNFVPQFQFSLIASLILTVALLAGITLLPVLITPAPGPRSGANAHQIGLPGLPPRPLSSPP